MKLDSESRPLVFLDHHHAAWGLIDDRCTFGCVTQCVTLIVAFERRLARGSLARVWSLLRVVGLLHQNERDALWRARRARLLIVPLVTILIGNLRRESQLRKRLPGSQLAANYLLGLLVFDVVLRQLDHHQVIDVVTVADGVERAATKVVVDAHGWMLDQQVLERRAL